MENNIKLKKKENSRSFFANFVIASWTSIFVIMTYFTISVQWNGEESIFNDVLHSHLSEMYLSDSISLIGVTKIIFFILSILIFFTDIENKKHDNYAYIDTEEESTKKEGEKNTETEVILKLIFVALSYIFLVVESDGVISNSYVSNENIKVLPSAFKELISEKKICDFNNVYTNNLYGVVDKKEPLTPYTYREIKDMQKCEKRKINYEQNEKVLKDKLEEQVRAVKE